MHMREEGNETQDGDNLELQLVGSMRHALWQGMQPKEQNAEHQDGEPQDDGHDDHEHVRLTRGGDERRQMMGGSGVKRLGHTVSPDAFVQAPQARISYADRSRAIPTLRLRLLEFNDTKVQLRVDRYVPAPPLGIISELRAACVRQRRSIPRMFG